MAWFRWGMLCAALMFVTVSGCGEGEPEAPPAAETELAPETPQEDTPPPAGG